MVNPCNYILLFRFYNRGPFRRTRITGPATTDRTTEISLSRAICDEDGDACVTTAGAKVLDFPRGLNPQESFEITS